MKKIIIIAAISFVIANNIYSQGCIVVRNISGFGQYNLTSNAFTTSAWQLNTNNRYFKVFHDYQTILYA